MARVLLAVPGHTALERELFGRLERLVQEAGHQTVALPAEAALDAFRNGLLGCDAVVAVVDGATADPRVAATIAYAAALRRPTLALRTDARPDAIDPLLLHLTADLAQVASWDAPETKSKVAEFLQGVRVFAGALVRDSVPSILKQEGRELRFRQVADSEYPHVLKRKLVETAQRLEDADFGVEQEEIADVLELLETLINLRRYDKESLRSIKEGKWRKRGGFAKGYLLDEEPVLSSR
ncbi:MAG: hypothetical protein HYT80_08810 [Euryarchaeota archaeon]|nr:hypothetical protein [Euryarchaeota archaeon]